MFPHSVWFWYFVKNAQRQVLSWFLFKESFKKSTSLDWDVVPHYPKADNIMLACPIPWHLQFHYWFIWYFQHLASLSLCPEESADELMSKQSVFYFKSRALGTDTLTLLFPSWVNLRSIATPLFAITFTFLRVFISSFMIYLLFIYLLNNLRSRLDANILILLYLKERWVKNVFKIHIGFFFKDQNGILRCNTLVQFGFLNLDFFAGLFGPHKGCFGHMKIYSLFWLNNRKWYYPGFRPWNSNWTFGCFMRLWPGICSSHIMTSVTL